MPNKLTETWFPTGEDGAPDPVRTVQAGLKPVCRSAFTSGLSRQERDGAFVLLLDGRSRENSGP
jgi:hypothetical protein